MATDDPVRRTDNGRAGGSSTGDRPQVTITDPQVMRALAHPARLAILEHLSSTGADATATELAEVCGLSPSATSYHLRALAKVGMVGEAPSRGDGRERVWRTALGSWGFEVGHDADPATRDAERVAVEAFLHREDERVRRWMARAHDEPREWYDATVISETVMMLTADELAQLNREVLALVSRYRRRDRAEPPPGARAVAALYRALPID